jgi:hypothetical protein
MKIRHLVPTVLTSHSSRRFTASNRKPKLGPTAPKLDRGATGGQVSMSATAADLEQTVESLMPFEP